MVHVRYDTLENRLQRPVHRSAFLYWSERQHLVGGIPGRQDIDPLDIPSLLPWVNLIEVHRSPGGLRYRHRLVGTAIVDIRDRDGTGRWFDELYGAERLSRVQRLLSTVVWSGLPNLFEDDLRDIGKPYWRHGALILPLATDHQRVDMLLCVSQYE